MKVLIKSAASLLIVISTMITFAIVMPLCPLRNQMHAAPLIQVQIPGSANSIVPPYKYLGKYIPNRHFLCQSPRAKHRCLGPWELYRAYNIIPLFKKGITGRGRTIAIIGFGLDPAIGHDLHTFDQIFHLPDPTLHIYIEKGAVPNSGAALETSLDVEYAHAIAPAATINLILTQSARNTDVLAATAFVIQNNLGDVLSQSYGENEADVRPYVKSLHRLFVQATKRHITLLAASGDTGAAATDIQTGLPVSGVAYPASDPLVTSVGGTNLRINAQDRYQDETAWNHSNSSSLPGNSATGGGFSSVFSRPAYQNHIPGIGFFRGIPDVAYNANDGGIIVVCSSCNNSLNSMFLVVGTSAGSPQWAGIVALADQLAGKRLGFLNPIIYKIARSGQYLKCFHDVQAGNNTYYFKHHGLAGKVIGYRARKGWDAATGWGSPNVAHLVYQLR